MNNHKEQFLKEMKSELPSNWSFDKHLKPKIMEGVQARASKKSRRYFPSIAMASALALTVFISVNNFMQDNRTNRADSIQTNTIEFDQLTKTRTIDEIIYQDLKRDGFSVTGVHRGVKKLQIVISESANYFNQVKKDVEKHARDILESKGYDAYSLEILRTEKDSAETRQNREIVESINEYADVYQYHIIRMVLAQKSKGIIQIHLPNSETEERISAFKRDVALTLVNQKLGDFNIVVKKGNIQDNARLARGWEVVYILREDLQGKKQYKVNDVMFADIPDPVLTIDTDVRSTDKSAREYGEKLEKVIRDFLQSEDMKSTIKNDTYRIEIIGSDNVKLN